MIINPLFVRSRIFLPAHFFALTFLTIVFLAVASAQQSRNRGQLPENVEKRSVTIWSDGTRMAGDLYLPKNRDANQKLPAIVFCAGTGGTKSGTGGRLGPTFAAQGYAALAFDYRGWGESDSQLMSVDPQAKADSSGEMTVKVRPLRWQMNYTDQTEDIRAAISFLAGEPSVDPERIGIMGSSYGGGLVTWVGGNDPRVKCVVAQVPGLGATRSPAADRRMFELHTQQARGETEPVPIETGKLGGKMERYDQMRSNPAKNIGFYSVDAAKRMSVPILFVVAENEELSNNDNVLKVHEEIKARGVPTEYVVIKGITHYGIYREGAEEATKIELAWFDKYLKRKDDKVTAATPPESKAGTKAGGTQTNPPRANRVGMNPKTAFERLDSNGDGELSDSELATLQSTVPFFKNNPDAFKPFMQRLDTNRDGKLNLEGYTGGIERFGLLSESKFKCRSVYLPVIRGRAFESMDVFDGVDGSMVVGKRDQTTVPTQSLYLLNSPYVMELATSAAGRLTSEARTPEDRVIWVYNIMLGRKPTKQEVETALAFIDKVRTQSAPTGRFIARLRSPNVEQTAWAAFCQSVWASGEFLVRK